MKLFSWLLHTHHSPTYERGSAHVRDTCMNFSAFSTCKFGMLVTCSKCFRISNVSFLVHNGIRVHFRGNKRAVL